MIMDEKKQYVEPQEEEEESGIDFGNLFATLMGYKKLYCKVLLIVVVLGYAIMFSIPNYYNCEVQLAPELTTSGSKAGTLSALASSFGMKLGSGAMGQTEALYPALYPSLVNSTDFKVSLFNVPVHKKDSTRVMTYYDYLKDGQKMPWWGAALKGVASLFAEAEEALEGDTINPFLLTKEQTAIMKALDEKVVCDVDNKTMVITISVTDQDPLICATIADSVQARLQDFITEYRTKKARVDLEFTEKLYKEAKADYDEARRLYTNYADANQDMVWQSARTKLMDLENEMQLQYNKYNTVAQQLMSAQQIVQEETPSFTTLQRATVPIKKAGPGRTKMVLIFLFIAFLGTSAWILYKEDQLKPLLGLS